MPTTHTLLASASLSSLTTEITFSSIDQTYTDLFLVLTPTEETANSNGVRFRFNGDTSSNYQNHYALATNGATTSSFGELTTSGSTSWYTAPENSSGPNHMQIRFNIHNYSNSNVAKTTMWENNKANYGCDIGQTNWTSTAAITSISILTSAGAGNRLNVGTLAYLYGIKAA